MLNFDWLKLAFSGIEIAYRLWKAGASLSDVKNEMIKVAKSQLSGVDKRKIVVDMLVAKFPKLKGYEQIINQAIEKLLDEVYIIVEKL